MPGASSASGSCSKQRLPLDRDYHQMDRRDRLSGDRDRSQFAMLGGYSQAPCQLGMRRDRWHVRQTATKHSAAAASWHGRASCRVNLSISPYPPPSLIQDLGTAIYPQLAPIANQGNERMGTDATSNDAPRILKHCHAAGPEETASSTAAIRTGRLQQWYYFNRRRTHFVYYLGMIRIPEVSAPDIKNNISHFR